MNRYIKATITIPPSKQKHFEEMVRAANISITDEEYLYIKALKTGKQPSMILAKEAMDRVEERRRIGKLMKEPLYSVAYTVAINRRIDRELGIAS